MDLHKLNRALRVGLSDEGVENVRYFFWRLARRKIKLSDKEKTLCCSLGYDERMARIIKSHNVSEITKLPSVNDYGKMDFDNSMDDGICAFYVLKESENFEEIERSIYRNKQKYAEKGYNLFYFQGDQYGAYYMALVKNKTTTDILRWSKTNGINHDIDNDDLIAKIEEWQQRYDFVLWGCGRDWLHIFFIHEEPKYNHNLGASNRGYNEKRKLWEQRTPKFKDFAKEVAEFCPDAIGQVYGSKTKLIAGMKQTNELYLWWD